MQTALVFDTHDLTQAIARSLRVDFGDSRSSVKELARAANSNERSAKNWYYGHNCPNLVQFLRIWAQSPQLRAEIDRLCGMEERGDPEAERLLNAIIDYAQRGIR